VWRAASRFSFERLSVATLGRSLLNLRAPLQSDNVRRSRRETFAKTVREQIGDGVPTRERRVDDRALELRDGRPGDEFRLRRSRNSGLRRVVSRRRLRVFPATFRDCRRYRSRRFKSCCAHQKA
jgi:hypothetical protein